MIVLQRTSSEYFITEVTIKVADHADVDQMAEALRLFMVALGYDIEQCLEVIPDPFASDSKESKESIESIDDVLYI